MDKFGETYQETEGRSYDTGSKPRLTHTEQPITNTVLRGTSLKVLSC
jgi:hypothetical protein